MILRSSLQGPFRNHRPLGVDRHAASQRFIVSNVPYDPMRTFEFLPPAAWVHQVPAPGGQTHILHLVVMMKSVLPSLSFWSIQTGQRNVSSPC